MNKVVWKKGDGESVTPQDFYNELNKEFHFRLDPACTTKNKKCRKGYCIDRGENGLLLPWAKYERIFLNPPYGRGLDVWCSKAYAEAKIGALVVGLLPARTDTKWFHHWIYKRPKVEIRFIRGRLKFSGSKDGAPFPSMVVIWRPWDVSSRKRR